MAQRWLAEALGSSCVNAILELLRCGCDVLLSVMLFIRCFATVLLCAAWCPEVIINDDLFGEMLVRLGQYGSQLILGLR